MTRSKAALIVAALLVISAAALAAVLLFRTSGPTELVFDPPYPRVNAHGDPILAVYEGRTPCALASCTGISLMKVSLVFYGDPASAAPRSYWLGYVGVGAGNDRTIFEGPWTIQHAVKGYPDATVYALGENAPGELQYYWRVNEDILLPLDRGMSPKVGNGAWGYMLSRYTEPYGPRVYRR